MLFIKIKRTIRGQKFYFSLHKIKIFLLVEQLRMILALILGEIIGWTNNRASFLLQYKGTVM